MPKFAKVWNGRNEHHLFAQQEMKSIWHKTSKNKNMLYLLHISTFTNKINPEFKESWPETC